MKGEYFDGALNVSLAAFRVDQTNRAFVPLDQTGCPTYPRSSCSIAAGLVRSQGIDAEIQGAITPNWQIQAGYTYTNLEYVKDSNPENQGKRFSPDQPEHMAKLNTTYSFDRLKIGGGIYWQSGIYRANSSYRTTQSAYFLANLMAGYKLSDKLDIQANLNNVFDKIYYRQVGIPNTNYDVYGDPRNFLVTLRARY